MTTEKAISALEALVKDGFVYRNNQAYKSAVEAVKNPGNPIVCGKNTGSGRYSGSHSWADRTGTILAKAGIQFSISNVAPNGGKHGDRITVNF